jgi:hypothetical protein
MRTEDHDDGVPMPDVERSLLSPHERAAVMARLRADDPEKLAHDYGIKIYDDIMGRLWDSTTLMKRGRDVRNDTILLMRAMLIQIISDRG